MMIKKTIIILKYILYFLVTIEERTMYERGLQTGYNCTKMERVSGILPSSHIEFTYDTTSKPKRDYLTFKEFRNLYN